MARTIFEGRVQRLYSDEEWTRIRLDIPPADQPEENYFVLRRAHENYNALFSLALSAAINGNALTVRTYSAIDKGEEGIIRWMVVDWDT